MHDDASQPGHRTSPAEEESGIDARIEQRQLSRRSMLALGSAVLPASLLLPHIVRGQEFSQSPIAPPEARRDPKHSFWKYLQDEFPLEPEHVHFNTAEYGIPPLQSLEAMSRAARFAAGQVSEMDAQQSDPVRHRLAKFVGVDASEIALCSDATQAMGWIADALPLERGARVVLSSHEPASSMIPWEALAREQKIDLQVFEPRFEAAQDVRTVQRLLEPGGVLVISHVSATQGSLMPVQDLTDVARKRRSSVIVNGSYAVGIMPLRLSELQVDAYVACGHGWLLGPVGTAFLFVRSALLPLLKPRYGTADAALAASASRVELGARAFETAPFSAALAAGLEASIEWIDGFGMEPLRERSLALAQHLYAGLAAIDGIDIVTPEHSVESVPVVSFRVRRRPNTQVSTWLRQELGMHVQRMDVQRLNAVRVSTSLINRIEDVDWLVKAARALA